jgi:hypothetical protein
MVNWRRNFEQKSLKVCVKILKYKSIYISIIYLSSIKIYFICFRNLNVTFKIYIELFENKTCLFDKYKIYLFINKNKN